MVKRDARIEQTARLEQSRQVMPIGQQTPPTHQHAPPTNQQAPPTHQQTPPTHQQTPPTQQSAPPPYHLGQQQQHEYRLRMQQLQQQQYQQQLQLQVNGPHQVPAYQAQLSPRQAAAILGQVVPASPTRRYRAKTAKTMGSLQIALAIVSLVLGIVTVAIGTWASFIGVPIWGGICFYLPAGILGVVSTKPTNMQNCVITSCMTMSVLSAIVAGTSVIISGIAAASEYKYVYPYDHYWDVGNSVVDVIVALIALMEMLVAITQSAFCCKYRCACCHTQSRPQAVEFTTPAQYASAHNRNMQPPMSYQQQQQFVMLQQQRQMPAYRAQGIVPLQSATRDMTQPVHLNSVSDVLMSRDESQATEPELPAYTDSPPPSYSLCTGYM